MKKARKTMHIVQAGDTIKVNYSALLSDGTMIVNTTQDRRPVRFTVGVNAPFPALERVVLGMKKEKGEFRTKRIPAVEVFGKETEYLGPLLPTNRKIVSQDVVFSVWLLDSD